MKYLQILLYKLVIWDLKKGYGARCPDFCEDCWICQAYECIDYLEEQIELIK